MSKEPQPTAGPGEGLSIEARLQDQIDAQNILIAQQDERIASLEANSLTVFTLLAQATRTIADLSARLTSLEVQKSVPSDNKDSQPQSRREVPDYLHLIGSLDDTQTDN